MRGESGDWKPTLSLLIAGICNANLLERELSTSTHTKTAISGSYHSASLLVSRSETYILCGQYAIQDLQTENYSPKVSITA
jgi:hypothetical protein